MPHPNDVFDLFLLRNDTEQFILRCQRTIEIVIKQCIKQGLFESGQYEDLVQSVNEGLIKRLPLIERNFNGSVRLETYLSAVIRNICLRLRERERNVVATEPLEQHDLTSEERSTQSLVLLDERQRLSRVLRLFGTKRSKLTFCLKVYYRLRLQSEDAHGLFPHTPVAEVDALVRSINASPETATEITLFSIVAEGFARDDGSSTTGDSLRRWTTDLLKRVIVLMNGEPPNRSHTRESIGILLEHFDER